MKVTVNQKHIDKGIREDPLACLLTLAFQDVGLEVRVGYYDVSDMVAGKTLFAHTKTSKKFIDDFDVKKKVKPHTFLFKKVKELT